MEFNKYDVAKLIDESLDNYTISNFNFNDVGQQAEFNYKGKIYRVKFVYRGNDQDLGIDHVWHVVGCSIYSDEITDLIKMCIEKQIRNNKFEEYIKEIKKQISIFRTKISE